MRARPRAPLLLAQNDATSSSAKRIAPILFLLLDEDLPPPDITAPTLTLSSPVATNGAAIYINTSTIGVAGAVDEPVTLQLDGRTIPVASSGEFTVSAALAEGANTLILQATDASGNTTRRTLTVVRDTVPPVITVTAPAADTQTASATVSVEGATSEPVTLTLGETLVVQNNPLTFSTTVPLAEGSNEFALLAVDRAGNTANTTVGITRDTAPPTIEVGSGLSRGLAMDGLVPLSGRIGLVEGGSVIDILNTRTGEHVQVEAAVNGVFSTQMPGVDSDRFEIAAADPLGNRSTPIALPDAPTQRVALQAIGDRTVRIGTTLAFMVSASHGADTPVTLSVVPTPLPAGASFNRMTGEFAFTPTPENVGVTRLTFAASTGSAMSNDFEEQRETVTLTVPTPDAAAPTRMLGRVLDATSMSDGSTVPVIGATVSFLDTGVSTQTDADGYFVLSGLPADADTFDIDTRTAQPAPGGALYGSFRELLHLQQNVDNPFERPFYLPRVTATAVAQVIPQRDTVIVNEVLGVRMTVPANTATNADTDTPYTGEISISEVPTSLAPVAMPDTRQPGVLITLQPVGVNFSRPIPITFPNVDRLPPGTEAMLWSVSRETGRFEEVGRGVVSSDGQRIETVEGGVTTTSWHFAAPTGSRNDPSGPPQQNPEKPCKPCQKQPGGSLFGQVDGHMSTSFSLPAYRSLGTSRAVGFSYSSYRAYPRPVVEFNGVLPPGGAIPELISYEISVGGVRQGDEVFIATSDFSGARRQFRTALTFDASAFTPGMYDYTLRVTNHYPASVIGTLVDGRVMVENEASSPFGAGWMLDGLTRLAFNADDSVTLLAPSGMSVNYRPAPGGGYVSPGSEFAVFAREGSGYVRTSPAGNVQRFDTQGRLTARSDRHGNTTRYEYASGGAPADTPRPIGIIGPVGRRTTLAYNSFGQLQTVSDPAGRTSTFEHDGLGNLVRIEFPDGTEERFEYDSRHLMVAHADGLGNRSTDSYDMYGHIVKGTLADGTVRRVKGKAAVGLVDVSSGLGSRDNPAPATFAEEVMASYVDGRGNASTVTLDAQARALSVVDELGRTTTHERDADSNPTRTTRPIGSVVTRTFDDVGNVLTETEAFNGATTTYAYDAFSQVTRITNPRGNTMTIRRDARGNAIETTNALGHVSTARYDARGLMVGETSPNGLVTAYGYDDDGLLVSRTETPPADSPGSERQWTYRYDAAGLPVQSTTPDGITLDYRYDARGDLQAVTDNLGQSSIYTYDAHKNVIRTETLNADGSPALDAAHFFDVRNRPVETRLPHESAATAGVESITRTTLDQNGNVTAMTDPNGHSSTSIHDKFNRLSRSTHREGGITEYAYDAQDRIISVAAPNGATTTYEYDVISRRTREVSPDRGTVSYSYDLANNLASTTDARGITATLAYDALERPLTKTYPGTRYPGKDESVSYTYDSCPFGLGRLCARSDESGDYAYSYDAFGNLTSTTFTEAGGQVSYTTAYAYDDGDRIETVTLPSGRNVEYTRDGVRRLEAITATINGAAQSIVSEMRYRGDSQLASCTFGNGTGDRRTYDLQGRLTYQQLTDDAGALVDSRRYTHDANGNILGIDGSYEDNAYHYDRLDRLVEDGVNDNPAIKYEYDLNDNRIALTESAAASDPTAEFPANEALEYLANSNRLLSREQQLADNEPPPRVKDQRLEYNDAGRFFRLTEDGALKADYVYNDDGQRTRKTTYAEDGTDTVTVYLYDQQGRLLAEASESGAAQRDYVWSDDLTPVAQIDVDGGGTGAEVETLTYLHTDHLMTPRVGTDEFQSVVWRWEGRAFGEDDAVQSGRLSVNLRFPGQYIDRETGLHYNYWRFHAPGIGRYGSSDPIGLGGGSNTFAYAGYNPITYKDPLGLAACGWADTTFTCQCKTPTFRAQSNCRDARGVLLFPNLLNDTAEEPNACPVPGVTPGKGTKGRSKNFEKPGDSDTANNDFDQLAPSGVRDKGDGVRVGTLPDGRTVIVRPKSTDGRPTIEIQRGKNKVKIRYGS